ncbi:hypothetical protein [Sorangium sp. So ce204]|uniref:hypothetical protein n=1 Tax=Sorangium sp. So ce204 TaxID=3133288 RepID=UPI003F5EC9C8
MTARTMHVRRTSHGESTSMKRAGRAALASIAAGAISVAGVTPVRAEPTPTPLRVRIEFIRGPGAEDCPDEPFLRAETVRAMGGVDPYDAEAPFTMTASIERRHGKLAASLFLRDGDGHGRWADGFSARDDCKVLVTAMAVSIALLLDDAAELPAPPVAPAKPASPPAPPEEPCSPERPCPPKPAPAPPSSPAPPTPPRTASPVRAPPRSSAVLRAPAERFRWVAGLGAVAGLGMTPGVAAGPALSVGARWPAWSVALEVRGLAALSANGDAVAMSVSTLTTDVVFCLDRRSLFACGLAELGVRHAVAAVPFNTTTRLNLRAGFGARAGIEWPLSENLAARAHADVVHPVAAGAILRHPDDPEPERPVWSAPAVTVALGVGLQASF